MCAALGRSELADLTDDDGSHEMLRKELALEFSKKTLKEWTDLLAGKDTCTTPVLDFAEAMAAEQTLANEMVLEAEDEEVGKYRQIGFPMKLSVTPAELFRRAPRLGEHNQEILRECGFDDASEERGKR